MMNVMLMALAQFVATAWGVFAGMCIWGYFICRYDDEEGDEHEAEAEDKAE